MFASIQEGVEERKYRQNFLSWFETPDFAIKLHSSSLPESEQVLLVVLHLFESNTHLFPLYNIIFLQIS